MTVHTPEPVYGPFPQPQQPEHHSPPGHGDPHPPSGGFSADAASLITVANCWDDMSEALKSAWDSAIKGWGYPTIFGMQDTLYVAGRLHMEINKTVVNALADGAAITSLLADGLVETANDFSKTDASQGAAFRTLEARAGE
ncbi:MAG: hypothetical protein JWN68_2358 [Nocardioides sp.]|jgi:hypothetical protein|uniref:hypothetical protein n=1 Tax=Nocardioides sp. TaxID=35761 RepID=UPI002626A64A|nr:hypothetical protein [Nocardioides sp.]MCW2834405.1 hypothetical protein [Nocardioides sp.]